MVYKIVSSKFFLIVFLQLTFSTISKKEKFSVLIKQAMIVAQLAEQQNSVWGILGSNPGDFCDIFTAKLKGN